MKAAIFKQVGAPLEIGQVLDPEPGPTDLILKVKACGICGTDLHWTENTDASAGWRMLKSNAVMGHEFAGEVVEVGRELRSHWKVGDRACALPFYWLRALCWCLAGRSHRCQDVVMRATSELSGAYAEYTRVGEKETLQLPESVSFQSGALVEPLAVGLRAVRKARLEASDSVLIVGAGPVGIAVAFWCRFFGARHIIVSDKVIARAERAATFGATAAIDASREDVRSRAEQVAGKPPQAIF